jgi:hypothetical protein
MIWECSECGGQVIRLGPPDVCSDCGTAGAIFVRADETEAASESDSFYAAWFRAGMERGYASAR